MGTDTKVNISSLVYYPILSLVCLEIALLIMGYRPYRNTDYSINAVPQNAFIGHPEMGIQLNPGQYTITINDSLSFTTHHLGPMERAIAPKHTDKPKIAMLGCSYTYGLGVSDGEHFTSLLQNDFPQASFIQRAVIGHGTVQSLMETRHLINDTTLKSVILNLSSYHLMRNTLSPTYRSHLRIGYGHSDKQVQSLMRSARFPYKASCDDPIQYSLWSDIYDHWSGREWSATINWVQTNYDRWREDHELQIKVTACMIKEMSDLCVSKNISFAVVVLDETQAIIQLKNQLRDIDWIDVGFDFKDPDLTNLPFDNHPSIAGHRYIAQKIRPFLVNQFSDE